MSSEIIAHGWAAFCQICFWKESWAWGHLTPIPVRPAPERSCALEWPLNPWPVMLRLKGSRTTHLTHGVRSRSQRGVLTAGLDVPPHPPQPTVGTWEGTDPEVVTPTQPASSLHPSPSRNKKYGKVKPLSQEAGLGAGAWEGGLMWRQGLRRCQ